MNNPQILEIIENLKGRRAYEEKRASKLGFSSLYAYIEDKILKKKVIEESEVSQNKIENDKAEESVHFGYFLDEKIVGIASVLKDKSTEFEEENQFRLRGMAVLSSYRNYDIGKKLLQHSEKYCIEKNAAILWFNAREKIVPFYKKYDFQSKGSIFDIPTVGPHQLMIKFFK